MEVIPLHVPRLEKRMRRRDYIVIKKLEVITMAKDPSCGMEVKESQAAATREYKGQKFYFCTSSCYDAFEKNPDKYVSVKKEGWWARFLNRLAQANLESYGGKALKCH